MILASYTLPASVNVNQLAGMVIRCYATGRYQNNTGAAVTPTISTSINGTNQTVLTPSVLSNAVAYGWRLWAHFYVSNPATVQAGTLPSIGSNIELAFTAGPQSTSTQTGVFKGNDYLALDMNPYNTQLNPSLTTTFAINFNVVSTDVVEMHASYMEAL